MTKFKLCVSYLLYYTAGFAIGKYSVFYNNSQVWMHTAHSKVSCWWTKYQGSALYSSTTDSTAIFVWGVCSSSISRQLKPFAATLIFNQFFSQLTQKKVR